MFVDLGKHKIKQWQVLHKSRITECLLNLEDENMMEIKCVRINML